MKLSSLSAIELLKAPSLASSRSSERKQCRISHLYLLCAIFRAVPQLCIYLKVDLEEANSSWAECLRKIGEWGEDKGERKGE